MKILQKIAILTDSSSGINTKESKKYKIYILPLHIILNNKIDILDSDQIISDNFFYKKIKSSNIKTSQANLNEITNIYNKILKKYDYIIHYPIAEKLSNQYYTAYMISQNIQYKNKVYVVKNHTAAFSLKRLVFYANQLAKQGKTIKEILDATLEFEKSTLMALIPGNIYQLMMGGRVKKLLLNVITIFKIKILIQWSENPKKIASSRKIKLLIENFVKLLQNFQKNIKYKYQLFILKTTECTSKIWNIVINVLENEKILYQIEKLPNIFVAHAGLDTIAFVTIPLIN